MDLITATADRICNVVSTRGEAQSSEARGDIKAQLTGLASKLENVGLSGSGNINTEAYEGVLRQDLATTLNNNAACKFKVFDTLQDKLLGQVLIHYASAQGIKSMENASSPPLSKGVIEKLRASLCTNQQYLGNLTEKERQSIVAALGCREIQKSGAPSSLEVLQGRWTLNRSGQCGSSSFNWLVSGDEFYFRNQQNQDDIEKIVEIANDGIITKNVKSSHGDQGTLWFYRFHPDDRVRSRNLSTGEEFVLTRCPNS
jgi:hypothetical protein